jgi:hypothetical protein
MVEFMAISTEGKLGIATGLLGLGGAGAVWVIPTHIEIGYFLIGVSIVGFLFLAVHHFRSRSDKVTGPCLQWYFSEDIRGCVQRDAVRYSFAKTPFTDPFVPPFTTVQVGQGAFSGYIMKPETITLYRIKVINVGTKETTNCSGHLISIARGNYASKIRVGLTFEPAEKREEARAKTIHPQQEIFLDVFYVTNNNEVNIHSDYYLPGNVKPSEIFAETGEYILEVEIIGDGFLPVTANLIFDWKGDRDTTRVWAMQN